MKTLPRSWIVQKRSWTKNRWHKEKINIKMANFNPTMSIIILHANGVNTSIKRQIVSLDKKGIHIYLYDNFKKYTLNIKT